ncbi:MAG: RNA polymerase sporulation sigma factor SigH [Clostridia bacterium]|nr:RNA polymerase sporulation sigma factor SigH [Clostridia bacterium]
MVTKSDCFLDKKYMDKNDKELIKAIREEGDKNAINYIFERYRELIQSKASRFFVIGAEKDDIVQEANIGLYKAIQSFDLEKENSFKTFANLCIERQLITTIKSSNRQKHIPLNSSFSLNLSAYDENDDTSVLEILDAKTAEDPLDTITKKEYYKFIEGRIDENLSEFEKKVLNKYIQGESYISIAEKLESPVKSVDNAIQRIRKKASKAIFDSEGQE